MAMEEVKSLIEEGNKTLVALRAEVESVKSADVVQADKIAKIESDLAATFKSKQDAELAQKALEQRLAEMETKANRPAAKSGIASDEYKSAFIDFVRYPSNPSVAQKIYDLQSKATDVRTSTGASGGFALPEEIAMEIVRQVQDISPIRQIARVVTVGTSDYKELVDLNGFGTEWVGETDTRNQTNTPNLGEVAPTFGELAAKPEATRHSLEDLFFNVESWLTSAAVEAYSVAEGTAFVSGNGSNKPTGFLGGPTPVATADSSRAFGTLQYVATGQAAALATYAFDTFLDMIYTLKAGYRPNARWVMSSATMATLAKVKDSENNYVLNRSVAPGVPATIGGYPITIAEDMPAVGAGTFPVAFGDFSRGYLIADRVGMGIVRDEVTKPGYIRYIMFKRVGGKLKDTSAIKLMKVASS